MKTLVTGATGLVGRALLRHLDNPVVLSRDPERARRSLGEVEAHPWSDGASPPDEVLRSAAAVVHLAGEPIAAGRWTPERKRRIADSRVLGTQRLVERLKQAGAKPEVFVCASGINYYGDRGDEVLEESSSAGDDWLSEVCIGWESAAADAASLGSRVVQLRLGMVLAAEGGALDKMLPAFRMGVGGRLGDGRQWISWIHLEDVVGIILQALKDPKLNGPANTVAPNPVRNADFTKELGSALKRPTWLPVPELALKVVVGEMAQIVVGSVRAQPAALLAAGYEFRFPTLPQALQDVLRKRG